MGNKVPGMGPPGIMAICGAAVTVAGATGSSYPGGGWDTICETSGVGSKVLLGSAGAGAAGWEFSSAGSATGEPFGVGVRVGVKDDALGGEFSTFFISALSKISSRGETGAGFGDTKSTGDLALFPKILSKSV